MSEVNGEKSADELIQAVYEKRNYLFEWQVFCAENAPDFLTAYEQSFAAARVTGGLPSKYRECVYIAILASRREGPSARNHIKNALDAGATPREILDAILMAWTPTGALTAQHGIKYLVDVLVERGEYQVRDVPYHVTDREP